MVEVVFLKNVEDDQSDEHVDHHIGDVEDIEKYERPNFECRLNSILEREISVLDLFMELELIILETLTLVRQIL